MEYNIKYLRAADGHQVPVFFNEKEQHVAGSIYDGTMARIWFEQYHSDSVENVILFGYGDGTICDEILQKVPGRVIVFDPLLSFESLKMPERLSVYEDEKTVSQGVKMLLDEDSVETTLLLCHPIYDLLSENEWKFLCGVCDACCDDIGMMKQSVKRFYESMITNQIENFPRMKNGFPVSNLAKVWDEKIPIVLVSAGPSLQKNADQLKQLKGKALIFAVDTALPFLFERDIVPDVIVSTESSKPLRFFEDERYKHIPMVVTTNTNSLVLKEHQSERIWGNDHLYIEKILNKVGINRPRVVAYSGVATSALAVILELGAKKVVFVGQDLAYADDGESHIDKRKELIETSPEYLVDGYYGGKIQSRYDWCVFRDWMELHISYFPDTVFLNATEGGALIHGAKCQALADVVKDLDQKNYDIFSLLECYKESKISEKQFDIVYNEYRKSYEDLLLLEKEGYEHVFFRMDYREIPVIQLVFIAMKAMDETDRRVRFTKALSFVKQKYEEGDYFGYLES